uniref:Ankyrin repeat domain-containing protein 40-like isoform X1 n=1 Tax=Petromyzon marinus TaxID=7757 RepID=A0AAJ7XEZ2_PETMA|nr:ankyrin repeat domain-containing protein 40-like isoform X1 [Petromyzon marinus]
MCGTGGSCVFHCTVGRRQGGEAASERDREELLREAACLGDVDLVKRLVSEGVAVNSANDLNGWTGLHWACKRGRGSVVSFLLESGADKEALTAKGEKPQQLTSNVAILSLLGVEENGHRELAPAEGELPIVPNYLQSPMLAYVSDAGRRVDAEMRRDSTRGSASSASSSASSNNNNDNDDSTALPAGVPAPQARAAQGAAVTNGAPHGMAPPFHPFFFPTAYPLINQEELVVKVRLQPGCTGAPVDVDFVEVELSRRDLTMASLVHTCSLELGVDPDKVTRVRKLPNTRLRKDKDLTRLADFQELELVLGGGVGGELGGLSVVGSQDSLAEKPCFNARASKLTY